MEDYRRARERHGRISPTRVEEHLDSVEVHSTSTESRISDRLEVVEEWTEGWEPGMPRPWTQRSPLYDKPLPMPVRTPSPMPTPSPVGRREMGEERGETMRSPSYLVRPQPQQADMFAVSPSPRKESPYLASPQPKQASPSSPQKSPLMAAPGPQRSMRIVLPPSPVASPRMSPVASPRMSPVASPRMSPVASPRMSPVASPRMSPARPTQLSPMEGPTPITSSKKTLSSPDYSLDSYERKWAEAGKGKTEVGGSPVSKEEKRESGIKSPFSLAKELEAAALATSRPVPTGREGEYVKMAEPKEPMGFMQSPMRVDAEPAGHVRQMSPFEMAQILKVSLKRGSSPKPEPEIKTKAGGKKKEARRSEEQAEREAKPDMKRLEVEDLMQTERKRSPSPYRLSPLPLSALSVSPSTKNRLMDAYGHAGMERGLSPLGFADKLDSRKLPSASLMKPHVLEQPEPMRLSPMRVSKEAPVEHKPVRQVSPFTFLGGLSPAVQSTIRIERSPSPQVVIPKGRREQLGKQSPTSSDLIDMAERGVSTRLTKAEQRAAKEKKKIWEHRPGSAEFFAEPEEKPGKTGMEQSKRYRKGNKDDWKAVRKYPVDHFFNPRLFYRNAQHNYPPGEWLRTHWQSPRSHFVDHFFNPSLFDPENNQAISLFDWYRKDWKVERKYYPEEFFEPSLFDQPAIVKRKLKKTETTKSMAFKSPLPRSPSPVVVVPKTKHIEASPVQKARSPTPRASDGQSRTSAMSYSEVVFGGDDQMFQSPTSSASDWVAAYNGDSAAAAAKEMTIDLSAAEGVGEWLADRRGKELEQEAMQQKRTLTPEEEALLQKRARSRSPITTEMRIPKSPKSPIQHKMARGHPDWLLWDTVISIGPNAVDREDMLDEFLANGVPPELRVSIWLSLLGLPMVSALSQSYPDLLEHAEPNTMLARDAETAVPEDKEEQAILTRIVAAYTAYDPVSGYAPGQLQLAMTLRQELPEELAFAGLVRIAFAWDQRRLMVPVVGGLRETLWVFDGLLMETMPELSEHFARHDITPDAYSIPWFQAVDFGDDDFNRDVFTWFLIDGRPALLGVGLALLAVNERRLLDCDDPDQLFYILQHGDLLGEEPARVILGMAREFYRVSLDRLVRGQIEFGQLQESELAADDAADDAGIDMETEQLMRLLARIADKVERVLDDRRRLLGLRHLARQELAYLHRVCYEQAYRLHTDEAQVIADQFLNEPRDDTSEESEAIEDGPPETSEQDRIADELVQVKVRYAEAQAEIDELQAQLAANQRRSSRGM